MLGMNPDVKAYGVIVNEFCKWRKPDNVISLIKEMRVR